MRVLVVGSGGREHALAWSLARSPSVKEVIAAPGNAGIARHARTVAVRAEDLDGLCALVRRERIDLTVVGPEAPLVAGLADRIALQGGLVFGPSAAAARLEGDKAYAKELMRRAGIPGADYQVFTDYPRARAHVEQRRAPMVVKASGLAAGKGVIVCPTRDDAATALEELMVRRVFGAAGATVVVEDYLVGEEASVMVICDGTSFATLAASQDHKRIGDGDTGPNTGGMGAYAPAPVMTPDRQRDLERRVLAPLLDALRGAGVVYRGLLYVGIIITTDGIRVLEFNCRFGDPEAQVVLPLLRSDFGALLRAAATGQLAAVPVEWSSDAAVCVVLASRGYPGAYRTGLPIFGALDERDHVVVFHAGTALVDGRLVTAGGRVLGVTACAASLPEAQALAYQSVKEIEFDGMYYRTDIARRGIKHREAP